MPLLQKAAGRVFKATAGKDPARFLSLPVGGRQVSLAFLSDLFQQAKDAGALESESDYTPADWFEEHRSGILTSRPPWIGRGKYASVLQRDLLEAVSMVEEVNRVRGIGRLTQEVRGAGKTNREVMAKLREIVGGGPSDDSSYVVWSPHGDATSVQELTPAGSH